MMGGNTVVVTDSNFEDEVIQSEVPVLVDFWAEWCGPCKMIAPVLEQIADEYEGRMQVVKLNVDEAQQTAFRYNVRSIPTLILFKNGQVEMQVVGAQPRQQITRMLEEKL